MYLTRFTITIPGKGYSLAEFRSELFNDKLASEKIKPEGIPNLWATAIVMKHKLSNRDPISIKLFDTYLKALWLGLLKVDYIKIGDNLFDKVIKSQLPIKDKFKDYADNFMGIGSDNLIPVFKYKEDILAYNYPETIFVPAAKESFWPDEPDGIEKEFIDETEKNFDSLKEKHISAKNDFLNFVGQIYGIVQNKKNEILKLRLSELFSQIAGNRLENKSPEDFDRGGHSSEKTGTIFISGDDSSVKKFDIKPFSFDSLLNKVTVNYEDNGKIIIDETEVSFEEIGIIRDNNKNYLIRDKYSPEGELEKKNYIFKIDKNKIIIKPIKEFTVVLKHEKEVVLDEIISINSIFPDKLFIFKREKDYITPYFPIYKRYEMLVDKTKDIKPVFKSEGILEYTLTIKSYGELKREIEYEEINESSEKIPQLFIWPNFKAEDWKVWFLHFSPLGKNPITVKVYTEDKELYFNKPRTFKLDKIPEYIVFVEGKEESKETEERGIFKFDDFINLKEIELKDDNKNISIAIDFGTSNTSSYILDFGDYIIIEKELIKSFVYENNKYYPKDFLPFKDIEILPSELLIHKREIDWSNGLQDYIIPYFIGDKGIDTDQIKSVMGDIKSNFKWSGTNPVGSKYEKEYVKAYLYQILLFLLARGMNKGYKKVKLGFSYPLAFSSNQVSQYLKILEEVHSKLKDETGMNFGDSIAFASESEAVGVEKREFKDENVIIIDIGGGSTDIAVLKNSEIKYYSSVEFGGKDLIKKTSKDSGTSYEELNWKVRAGKIGDINGNLKEEFFNIILELPRKISIVSTSSGQNYKPFDRPSNIKVVLMGQSWGFIEDNYLNYLKSFFSGEVSEYNRRESKKILCKGIFTVGKKISLKNIDSYKKPTKNDIVGMNFKLKNRKNGENKKIHWYEILPYTGDGINFTEHELHLEEDDINVLTEKNNTYKKLLKDVNAVRSFLRNFYYRPDDTDNNNVTEANINENALIVLIKKYLKDKFIAG